MKKVDAKCTANKELLWEVTYERSSKKNIEYFDAVAICNGYNAYSKYVNNKVM